MRYAICNELFEDWPIDKVCHAVADLGYEGIELAPFTLGPSPTDLAEGERRRIRRTIERAELSMVGLHWLLAKTTGLHLNSPDGAVRERTAAYLGELARLCADLGGTLLVFGSPAARKIPPGVSEQEAYDFAADTIQQAVPVFAECGVCLALEPLGPGETDFLRSAAEAARLMHRIDDPHVRLHLDVKALSTESTPIPDIIRDYAPWTSHFHANDPNLRGPGMGAVDFIPIFRALVDSGYSGWVSVEVFDFKPDPVTIARDSIEYMKRVLNQVVSQPE